jgi:DDE family transposase
LFSHLYPGKQDSGSAYIPILDALDTTLGFTPEQKQRTIVRSDAGFGGDANVNHALKAHWQLVAKGKGGKRPAAYARQVAMEAWQTLEASRWIAAAPNPPTYVRPTQHCVLRWLTEQGRLKYSTLLCSLLDWSMEEIVAHYDDRGMCETEIQADKRGLRLEQRRKKQLYAQEALILLTDVAHNLLAWTSHWMFPAGSLAHFGPLRLTQDVFAIPGRLIFDHTHRLTEVQLNMLHPHAGAAAEGLQRLLAHFGHP